ncbi:hypothetical protein DMUE_0604 [Dictyocoela muelleri]|nr:hypothetical protein DMUE_0604 [Dictyocoela muelleri]
MKSKFKNIFPPNNNKLSNCENYANKNNNRTNNIVGSVTNGVNTISQKNHNGNECRALLSKKDRHLYYKSTSNKCPLFTLKVKINEIKIQYLFDTGAEILQFRGN